VRKQAAEGNCFNAPTARWVELNKKALLGKDYRQPTANEVTQAKLRQLKMPTLLT